MSLQSVASPGQGAHLDDRTIVPSERTRGVPGPAPQNDRGDIGWSRLDGTDVVVKSGGGERRERLRREADRLRRCGAHAAVEMMELLEGAEHTELVTCRWGSLTLADSKMLGPDERAAALRSLCTAIDRLHGSGWAHGDLRASHVLIDDDLEVRFCSLASAVEIEDTYPSPLVADREALRELVTEVLQEPAGFDTGRRRRRWDRAAARAVQVLTGPGGLRSGHQIRSVLDTAGIPDPDQSSHSQPSHSQPSHSASVPLLTLAVVAAVVALIGAISARALGDAGGTGPATPFTTAGPPTTAGPSTTAASVGDRRRDRPRLVGRTVTLGDTAFVVGDDGDLPVLGDWNCDGTTTVALLRPRTFEVFRFDSWSGAGPGSGPAAAADPLGEFPGAVEPLAPPGECGAVRLRMDDGSVVAVLPEITVAVGGGPGSDAAASG